LSAEFAEFARIDGFDAALGADGHEDGSVDDAVGSREAAATGFGGRVGVEEVEHRKNLTMDGHG
jgi:hypothetical protein